MGQFFHLLSVSFTGKTTGGSRPQLLFLSLSSCYLLENTTLCKCYFCSRNDIRNFNWIMQESTEKQEKGKEKEKGEEVMWETFEEKILSSELKDIVVHETISIEEMEYDEEIEGYVYPCPCGDEFYVSLEEMRKGIDIAECPSCSLKVRVIFDISHLPPKKKAKEWEMIWKKCFIIIIVSLPLIYGVKSNNCNRKGINEYLHLCPLSIPFSIHLLYIL